MPRYEIELPDKRVLEVEAPDQAMAVRGAREWHRANPGGGRMQHIRAPDGSTVRFPAGTSDETIRDVMGREYGGPQPDTRPQPSYWGGLARQAAQGLSFGFADELEARLPFLRQEGEDYDAAVQRIRRGNERFSEENPVASFGAGLAGGVVPFTGGPLGALARRAAQGGLGRQMWRQANLGSGVGLVHGIGAGEGDLADRLPGGSTGALLGGAVGAAVPPVLKAGGAALGLAGWVGRQAFPETSLRLRNAMMLRRGESVEPPVPPASRAPPIEGAEFVNEMTPTTPAAQDRALRLMADQLLRAGMSADDVERALAEAVRSRRFHSRGVAQDATALVDVVPAWQRMAGAAWRAYPEAAADINRFVGARQTGITPAGANARELAERGLPTRERFATPLTGAQAERQLGRRFDTPEQGQVPMGHLERVRDGLRRAMLISDEQYHGHARTGVATVEQIVSRAEAQAQTAYAEAYRAAGSVNLRNNVGDVLNRYIVRAAREESTAVEKYLKNVRALFVRPGPRMPMDLRQFDAVKRELDGMIKDDLARPKYVRRGAILNQLKNDLLEAVDNATGGASSPYRAARQEFADRMSSADAYLMGRRALDDTTRLRRTGPGREVGGTEVTAQNFAALSKGEQDLFKLGLLDAVTGPAMRKPRAREALAIFETPRVQELLAAVIPRSQRRAAVFAGRPQRFGRYLEGERSMLDTRDVVRGNSMTARNMQDDLALAGMEGIQNVNSWLEVFKGSQSMWHLGQRIFEKIADRAFGMSADAGRELSRMLFTANPQERTAILSRLASIMPADRMARFNELLRRSQQATLGAGMSGAGGMGGAPAPERPGGPYAL